ncbi:MAG: plasmid stabilization protein [Hoeflea sp.]|uniref:plasmid stabilization protein n=1 Tax=Hoeflea sp. TaxID=1940281 RepID=UPI001DB2DD60|nr:plasmid stabilization protein [Hoeflea sp.]MBU4527605.1 plasmid stabilization protein [Alphaproteobacteria bacterium]MBU4546266.1 plasmid stabilization protein [Alphaproteobacteria bacterium]MBU4548877.1 plasmid stabilization protein [Alphaproteobacteria bacterium]MBV1723261.1 plasmid stabilization protein [Hoeflea sp.]MBV1782335.1 plasmid stabilization protein [Hoeflea sp.]
MAEPQLSVRSSKARDLVHRLAKRENRSVADVVERELEFYEVREAGWEPASSFYSRGVAQCGTDIDLDALVCENCLPHKGVEL